VTNDEKVKLSFKIIHHLLSKVHHDLVWWNDPEAQIILKDFIDENETWNEKGLDHSRLEGLVKSHWRHVRTRLYFTSASHMYTFLNILKLGLNSTLIDQQNQIDKEELENITTLDYMSGFVFRLYENLGLESTDPKRFKLEIMVNKGAAVEGEHVEKGIEEHTIPILLDNYIDINKQLTLDDIDEFFKVLL
jgi:inositol hexakisphosphate/diphosphoinositol-pentakisphosphate kinase